MQIRKKAKHSKKKKFDKKNQIICFEEWENNLKVNALDVFNKDQNLRTRIFSEN